MRDVRRELGVAGCPATREGRVRSDYPAPVNDTVLVGELAAVHRELFGLPGVLDFDRPCWAASAARSRPHPYVPGMRGPRAEVPSRC
ncbi:hypothetical protein RB201_25900 [Streptomyces sp. S1A(2023)]